MVKTAQLVTIDDVADGVASLSVDDWFRPRRPLLLVDLDQAEVCTQEQVDRAFAALRGPRGVLVGVRTRPAAPLLEGPAVRLLDLMATTVVPDSPAPEPLSMSSPHPGKGPRTCLVPVSDPEREARRMWELAYRHPFAALAIDSQIRVGASSSVHDALVAESFTMSMLVSSDDYRQWHREDAAQRLQPAGEAPVHVSREGAITHIVLGWPAKGASPRSFPDRGLVNALLAEADGDGDGPIVLSASGPDFCAGSYGEGGQTAADPAGAHLMRLLASLGTAAYRVHDRLRVEVTGRCVGRGLGVTAFGWHIRASADSTFVLPQISMAMLPGAGASVSITRRIGRWRTAYLALSGAAIGAATALDWGLVDEVVGPALPQVADRGSATRVLH